MRDIYDIHKRALIAFTSMSLIVVAIFLYYSDSLAKDLSSQERSRMQVWADATREIVNSSTSDDSGSYMGFLLSIIEANDNIPVLVTDDSDEIIMHRNFKLPEPVDSNAPLYISDTNRQYLQGKLAKLKKSSNVIDIDLGDQGRQHLYYEDSELLKKLSIYPYVLIVVLIIFISIVYFAVSSSKRAEQNKIWVGLSRETAHQLGTPISSLMAWISLLNDMGIDNGIVNEMDKDVTRLSTIASRFSKIGSKPSMSAEDINQVAVTAAEYMKNRISNRIQFDIIPSPTPLLANLSTPLISWVIENLVKNAVDAMKGDGKLILRIFQDNNYAMIEITDTGNGIPRKNFKKIFKPGYTTKERGWGLGLTLAKRIVEQYHHGKIYIKQSEIGKGTTFVIQLPILSQVN